MEIKIPINIVFKKIEDWKEYDGDFLGYSPATATSSSDFTTLTNANGRLAEPDDCYKRTFYDSSDFESFWEVELDEIGKRSFDDYLIYPTGVALEFFEKQLKNQTQIETPIAINKEHKVSLLYEDSVAPKRARPEETGYDLTIHRLDINEIQRKVCFYFGVAIEPAEGYDFRIYPRSSIHKTPFRMCNSIGLIDAPFRGELRAYCDYRESFDFRDFIGKSLFQLVESKVELSTQFVEVPYEELTKTERGDGGFGSTNGK